MRKNMCKCLKDNSDQEMAQKAPVCWWKINTTGTPTCLYGNIRNSTNFSIYTIILLFKDNP